MEANEPPALDNLIFGEIQVLLSEKRTALSSLRTGIAIFALPLSVLSVLIATSRYYSFEKVMPLLVPLLLLNLGLSFSVHDISEQAIAHLAYLEVRFPSPGYRGDTVRIWAEDDRHHAIFGVIEQTVGG